jgi:hypothetical protein
VRRSFSNAPRLTFIRCANLTVCNNRDPNEASGLSLQFAFSYSLDMVAWSAGLIAFTAGFLTDPATVHDHRWLLRALFVFYGISVVSGICVLSQIASIVSALAGGRRPSLPFTEMPKGTRIAATIQFAAFFMALILSFALGFAKTFEGRLVSL